jgi:hypothetical protein
MRNGLPPGGIDLSRTGQVQINSAIIVPVAAVDFLDGKLSHFEGDYSIRVIDLQKGAAWYMPASRDYLSKVHDQISKLIGVSNNGIV